MTVLIKLFILNNIKKKNKELPRQLLIFADDENLND